MKAKKKRTVFVTHSQTITRACPVCRAKLDEAMGASARPGASMLVVGTRTMCAYCGTVLVTQPSDFRVATQAEVDELPPLFKRMIAEWKPLFPLTMKTGRSL